MSAKKMNSDEQMEVLACDSVERRLALPSLWCHRVTGHVSRHSHVTDQHRHTLCGDKLVDTHEQHISETRVARQLMSARHPAGTCTLHVYTARVYVRDTDHQHARVSDHTCAQLHVHTCRVSEAHLSASYVCVQRHTRANTPTTSSCRAKKRAREQQDTEAGDGQSTDSSSRKLRWHAIYRCNKFSDNTDEQVHFTQNPAESCRPSTHGDSAPANKRHQQAGQQVDTETAVPGCIRQTTMPPDTHERRGHEECARVRASAAAPIIVVPEEQRIHSEHVAPDSCETTAKQRPITDNQPLATAIKPTNQQSVNIEALANQRPTNIPATNQRRVNTTSHITTTNQRPINATTAVNQQPTNKSSLKSTSEKHEIGGSTPSEVTPAATSQGRATIRPMCTLRRHHSENTQDRRRRHVNNNPHEQLLEQQTPMQPDEQTATLKRAQSTAAADRNTATSRPRKPGHRHHYYKRVDCSRWRTLATQDLTTQDLYPIKSSIMCC